MDFFPTPQLCEKKCLTCFWNPSFSIWLLWFFLCFYLSWTLHQEFLHILIKIACVNIFCRRNLLAISAWACLSTGFYKSASNAICYSRLVIGFCNWWSLFFFNWTIQDCISLIWLTIFLQTGINHHGNWVGRISGDKSNNQVKRETSLPQG